MLRALILRSPLVLLPLLPLLLAPSQSRAQVAADTTASSEALRLYLDCSGFHCDSDFYRTEIDFVSHVRDRQVADVHLLITPQRTGGGGTEYTLTFLGQRRFRGMTDTLSYVAPQAATEDERRRGLARRIELGLARYAARTPAAAGLQIQYATVEGEERPEAARDPWNFWTFRANLRGFFNGESRVSSQSLNGSLSANRVTDQWKIQLSTNGSERSSRFEINDSTTVTSQQSSYGLNSLVVRSLSPHWSAGVRSSASSSTFLNQDLHLRLAPALEYSIYPYSEATRRQMTLLYSVGANRFDYDEITIFDETTQTLMDHSLLGSLDFKQRWGSMNLSVEGTQFLHDTSRYRAETFTDLDVRLLRGLSVNLFGSLSWVRDQLYLPAGDATEEEILLRLRQLDTSYRYFASLGFSYTFGSIFNNVVNPRFGAGRSGMFIIN